jgi:hypothetical protein
LRRQGARAISGAVAISKITTAEGIEKPCHCMIDLTGAFLV